MDTPGDQDRAAPRPRPGWQRIDEKLLARAVEINEAVAGEFTEQAAMPIENPLIAYLADLGVEPDVAVGLALQRARRIAFYLRRRTMPRDEAELDAASGGLSAADHAQVAALAIAWWDGVLTALRA